MDQASFPWRPVARCEGYEYSIAKVADALDFFRPEVIEWIRAVGEEPRFHTKQWEYAQVLEARRRFAPNAGRLLGLGCGRDLIIPRLAEGAEEVVATDLYGLLGAWKTAAVRPDEIFKYVKNLRVHPMDMRKMDLPHESFDFIWSLCAVEHTGRPDAVIDVVRQAGKRLRPGGVLVLTTEYTFDSEPFYAPDYPSGTLFFNDGMLRRLYTDTGLHLVEPIDLRVSTHAMNVPVWDLLGNQVPNIPHVLYRVQPIPIWGAYGGCVCVVLCREDRGQDRLIQDPDQLKKLQPLFEFGRKMSRRLSPPRRWW
jgi:SAM-dependent methyltransferase